MFKISFKYKEKRPGFCSKILFKKKKKNTTHGVFNYHTHGTHIDNKKRLTWAEMNPNGRNSKGNRQKVPGNLWQALWKDHKTCFLKHKKECDKEVNALDQYNTFKQFNSYFLPNKCSRIQAASIACCHIPVQQQNLKEHIAPGEVEGATLPAMRMEIARRTKARDEDGWWSYYVISLTS